jgi:hypothetical protein
VRKGSAALVAAFAALAFLPACGDDSLGFGGGTGMYDDPEDFDRRTCDDAAASVDSVDPAGIWHANLVFPDGMSVVVFRIDAGVDAASIYGEQTDDVRRSSDDLFIRSAQIIDGVAQVVALDLCGADDEGRLIGQMASCYDRNCLVGRVTAYPVAPFDDVEAENMTLVSEWRGPPGDPWTESVTLNVRHAGTVAYLVGIRDGLRIVDLADPAEPADLGQLPPVAGEYFNDVKLATAGDRTYAYLASSARGVVLVDVTDPTEPVELATFPEPGIGESTARVHTLFIEGDRLYAAQTSMGGIVIYDIGDPSDPVQLGSYVDPAAGSFSGFVHDLSVREGIAYLNYWNLGMIAVDTREDPANPTSIGVFDDYDRRTSHSNWVTEAGGRLVAVHGDEDFDSHVRIIDVDPASETAFKQIGEYETRPQVSVHNIMAVGEIALATYYQDGLRVLDLSDPEKPTEVAHFASWRGVGPDYGLGFFEGAIGVDHDAERDLILLADTHRGLIVLTLDVPE